MQILLADNQPKVRFGLRVLLERQPGLQVVGEAADAEDLLAQVEADCPDLVLLDWELSGHVLSRPKGLAGGDPSTSSGQAPSTVRGGEPFAKLRTSPVKQSGQALLAALREACPDLLVIVLSGRTEVRRAALGAGADAFVCKCDPPEQLLEAIADCLPLQKQLVGQTPSTVFRTDTDKEVGNAVKSI
jgi:DNA-binding NarL/FixJ family response regulator